MNRLMTSPSPLLLRRGTKGEVSLEEGNYDLPLPPPHACPPLAGGGELKGRSRSSRAYVRPAPLSGAGKEGEKEG